MYSYHLGHIKKTVVVLALLSNIYVTSNENVSDWIPNSLGSSYFAKFATNNPIHNIYNNLLNIHHYKKSQYNYQHPYEKNGQVFSGSQKNTIFKSPPIRKQSNFLSKFFQNVKVNELKTALQSVYSTMVKNSVPERPNNIRRQFSLLGSPANIGLGAVSVIGAGAYSLDSNIYKSNVDGRISTANSKVAALATRYWNAYATVSGSGTLYTELCSYYNIIAGLSDVTTTDGLKTNIATLVPATSLPSGCS